ncbi:MAG: alkaline phosphatase family protein [Nitrospirae bacterium]|nr:alkaline phosphatase family protein [Nitrospirota bacterium]
MNKLVLICIDGATWDVIDPMINSGALPNFSDLKKQGAYGDFMSMENKLISPVIWMSIATGKVPEKHGIKDFFSSEADLKSLRFWEILAQRGFSYGLYNFFHVYPPDKNSAFCIPGVLAPGAATYPENAGFLKKIREERKRGVNFGTASMLQFGVSALKQGLRFDTALRIAGLLSSLKTGNNSFKDRYPIEKIMELYISTDHFCYLMRKTKPDISVFYENGADLISHYFWEEWETNGSNRKGNVCKYYEQVDRSIGLILQNVPDNANVFLVSDHGFQGIDKGARMLLMKTEKLLDVLGVSDRIYGMNVGYKCYLRAKDKNADGGLMKELEDKIGAIRFKEIDFPLIKLLRTSEHEIEFAFNQAELNLKLIADDKLIINENTEILAAGATFKAADILDLKPKQTGKHHEKGIFLAKGPHIKRGFKVERASVFDIAPTILRLMGIPAARDIDGKALTSILTDSFLRSTQEESIESYEAGSPVASRQEMTKDEEESVKERLRDMGYLS